MPPKNIHILPRNATSGYDERYSHEREFAGVAAVPCRVRSKTGRRRSILNTTNVPNPQEEQSWGSDGEERGTKIRGPNFHPDGYFRPRAKGKQNQQVREKKKPFWKASREGDWESPEKASFAGPKPGYRPGLRRRWVLRPAAPAETSIVKRQPGPTGRRQVARPDKPSGDERNHPRQ